MISNDPSHSLGNSIRSSNRVATFLTWIVRFRYLVIALGVTFIVIAMLLALQLRKDTSADAFIDPDNPALRYRKQVAEVFGLKDPIVIAIRQRSEGGIFNASTLQLVAQITEQLATIPNVDPDGIVSLATENAINADTDGMRVERLLDGAALDAASIARLRKALDKTPLYEGVLVSKDRSATLIVAELIDDRVSSDTYRQITALTQALAQHTDNDVFVSGEGAIGGYLSTYIDVDARLLLPIAAATIAVFLFIAFFTLRGVFIPLLVVLATVTLTLGVMSASGIAYFAITNGMAVALIGIAVADSVHVFSEYYTLMRLRPTDNSGQLIVQALASVWQAVCFTAITTASGFLALYATSSMPPIRYFGLFGAIGVAVAWLYTVTVLPAIVACLPNRQSRFFFEAVSRNDIIKRSVLWLGRRVIAYPRSVLMVVTLLLGISVIGMSQVKLDYERVGNFNTSEPLYQADREINKTFAGTYHIDIVIESAQEEGLLEPAALQKIAALQTYLEQFPQVGATQSIVDYIKQMNRALNDDRAESYTIPSTSALVAQQFLVYQASAAPTALERLLDSSHKTALVRAYLHTGQWSEQRQVVNGVKDYLKQQFTAADLTATATGRVVVDDAWMQGIANGQTASLVGSLLAVFVVCWILFRSFAYSVLALIPNVLAIAGVYAVMGFDNIWLGVATSMFASIATGLGVDFSIHTLERARATAHDSPNIDANLLSVYDSTGRALIFNTIAIACGFGVITLSSVPPIRLFGALVAAGIVAAYIGSLTALPALLKILAQRQARRGIGAVTAPAVRYSNTALLTLISIGMLTATLLGATKALADEPLVIQPSTNSSATEIMQRVAQRTDGATAQRTVRIQLVDRRGVMREQVTRVFRKNVANGRRTAVFYMEPANVRGTAFLTFDYTDAATEDDQWLYLPALRKVRRVPAAERGDYFLGTDLTYEEIRNDSRVTMSDWNFTLGDKEIIDGVPCIIVDGVAASPQIARELKVSRARWRIDTRTGISRRTDFWDQSNNALKTIDSRELQQVSSVWTPSRIEAVNHKTGHKTVLIVSDVDFGKPLADQLFTQQQLTRGL